MLSVSTKEKDYFKLSEDIDYKIGEKISGSYSVDFDIWKIHLIIRDLFSFNHKERSIIEKKIKILNKEISDFKKSFLKLQELKREKHVLEGAIAKFSEAKWEEYISYTKDLLTRYQEISTYSKTKTFYIGGPKRSEPDFRNHDTIINERIDLIKKYLKYVSRFIEMDVIFHPPYSIGCPECNLTIDEMTIDDDQGVYICACNYFFGKVFSNESMYDDLEKTDCGFKTSYDDKTNFSRRLKSYQGFQSRKIPSDLIGFLDKHMQDKYNLAPASEIRKMEPDRYGHKGYPKASVPLLIESLKETGNSMHFQDINPICYELWDWICPQIDHLVPKIMEDYTRIQERYKKKYPTFSSINVELRLYWHLRIVGHECLLEDFKIPQSIESKKRNSEIFETMCKETDLPFYPVV
jgi:hypothetical protein